MVFFLAAGSTRNGTNLADKPSDISMTIDFRGQDYWQSSSKVHWSKAGIAAAKNYETYQEQAFGHSISELKNSGAVTLKVTSTSLPDSLLTNYQIYAKTYLGDLFRTQKLVGYSDSGTKVGTISWSPIDGADLTSYLFKPSDGSCRLDGFKLFVPTTWFASECQLQPVKPSAVLRAALFTHLSIPDPRNAFTEQMQALQWIVKNRIPYEIKAESIYCPRLKKESFLVDSIPLKLVEFGSKYWITFGEGPWSVTFHQSAPDVQQVANHINLATDSMGRKFLTPWSKHW